MKFKDWLGVGALIAVGLMFLGGCRSKDPYLKTQYPLKYKCVFYNSVEKRGMSSEICDIPMPGKPYIHCTRWLRVGGLPHRGRHHNHVYGNCRFIFR